MMKADQVSGRQIAAGRVLAGISREVLAKQAKVSVETLTSIESRQVTVNGPEAAALRTALEEFGIRFIPENGGGAGV